MWARLTVLSSSNLFKASTQSISKFMGTTIVVYSRLPVKLRYICQLWVNSLPCRHFKDLKWNMYRSVIENVAYEFITINEKKDTRSQFHETFKKQAQD